MSSDDTQFREGSHSSNCWRIFPGRGKGPAGGGDHEENVFDNEILKEERKEGQLAHGQPDGREGQGCQGHIERETGGFVGYKEGDEMKRKYCQYVKELKETIKKEENNEIKIQ